MIFFFVLDIFHALNPSAPFLSHQSLFYFEVCAISFGIGRIYHKFLSDYANIQNILFFTKVILFL